MNWGLSWKTTVKQQHKIALMLLAGYMHVDRCSTKVIINNRIVIEAFRPDRQSIAIVQPRTAFISSLFHFELSPFCDLVKCHCLSSFIATRPEIPCVLNPSKMSTFVNCNIANFLCFPFRQSTTEIESSWNLNVLRPWQLRSQQRSLCTFILTIVLWLDKFIASWWII